MAQSYKLTVEEICRKLKPVFGKKIDEIYLRYAMADSREEREEITGILNILYQKNLNKLLEQNVLLEPPNKSLDGEYNLGNISYARKTVGNFNLREQDWMRHVCISGMSGSGKTTIGFHIVNNFIQKDKPFLIFDWKKSFRPLLKVSPKIMNFTVGDESISNLFKLNINKPPKGVNPKEWINVLCDLLTESFFASYGVHKILLETLDEAFKEWGIYNGSDNYPSWNHIKWRLEEKLEKTKGREAGWLESALRIASVLTFGEFGKTLNYKGDESIDIEELLEKQLIFELNALGNLEKKFFCEFILAYIYKARKANQTKISNEFKSAILVDEAHNIFLKDKTNFVNESITDMVYREMREYGISLICLDQHISKLSDTVAGNSACHIAFQQQLPNDIETISRLMQLNDRKEYFSKLPVGSAIVKLSERYTSPFLVEVEDVELRKQEVSNQEVKDRMSYILQTKEIEEGRDEDFKEQLLQEDSSHEEDRIILSQDPRYLEKQEQTIESPRVSKHALYDGELEEVKKIKKQLARDLTAKQEVLYGFILEKLDENWDIEQINDFIENRKQEGDYTSLDINNAIEYALDRGKISEIVTPIKEVHNEKVYKEKVPQIYTNSVVKKTEKIIKDNTQINEAQGRFVAFLQENPEHEFSTTELYRQVGLSARKGNKIKDELLKQGRIKIQEIKYNKGWKKIIRLC